MRERCHIFVEGIVQGVGFRSFVYTLAMRKSLGGCVFNDSNGVVIELEGERADLKTFLECLSDNPPALASIDRIVHGSAPAKGETTFRIAGSRPEAQRRALVSPDVSTCADCLAELFDPRNRRYHYPFINCTNCGPRFTIIKNVPYDRQSSTMADFPMCADCRSEFDDPTDRRFHAQPNACARCGPNVRLLDAAGAVIVTTDPIEQSAQVLQEGAIVAVKGLGGYHLACNAFDSEVVARLRKRKSRENKPFALMAPDFDRVKWVCRIDPEEEALLCSRNRPIVLLRIGEPSRLAPQVAPGHRFLGMMLPYTPLHYLLLKAVNQILVMTSGNLSEEPVAYEDAEALQRLGQIADYFLVHDRAIHVRCDDSVVRSVDGQEMIVRRSRGYAPRPIALAVPFKDPILACGAHFKNTFCLAKEHYAFVSQHIGALENYETFESFENTIAHFKYLFGTEPSIVAHDMHPQYVSTQYALELKGVTQVAVQHHHAHIVSCMAEHGLEGPVIGVTFDGLGYGEDGAIWGGEFFVATLVDYERRAHFRYIPLAGGDVAIRQPWRVALAYVIDTFETDPVLLGLPGWEGIGRGKLTLVQAMITRRLNTVSTSSCGRLFDAVASIVGLRHEVTYEGQAAVELESAALDGVEDRYAFEINQGSCWEIDLRPAVRNIVHEARNGEAIGVISAKFHNTVVSVIVEVSKRLREQEGLRQVCLSGGTFQNLYLLERVIPALRNCGFEVFRNIQVPPNDGGISLGQAVVASRKVQRSSSCA